MHTFYLSERVPNLFDPLLECIRIAVMGPDGYLAPNLQSLGLEDYWPGLGEGHWLTKICKGMGSTLGQHDYTP